MHVKRIGIDNVRATLLVELSAEEVTEYRGNAYMLIAMRNGLHPQRGRTSREIAVEAMGEERVARYASNVVMSRAIPLVIDMVGIEIVGAVQEHYDTPVVDGEPFSFSIVAVLKPRIPLTSYGPVEIDAINMGVDDETVDRYVEEFARAHGESVPDDERDTVEADSLVSLAMETTADEGGPVPQMTFASREYQLGSDDMPDGFDDNLLGAKVGQTRAFDFVGPALKDDGPDFSRAVTYHAKATVRAILKKAMPEVTDAWVSANIRGCSDLAQFKRRIRGEFEKRNDREFERYRSYLAASKLSERLDAPVPDEVFKAQYDQMLADFRESMQAQGLKEEDYVSSQGMTAQQFKAKMMSQTREQLRQGLALDAMAYHLGLRLTDEDMDEYYHAVAEGKESSFAEELKQHGGMQGARETALRMKTNRYIVEHAIAPTARTASV